MFGDPYFSFQKQILYTIISTLSKNEQKINMGSEKNFKISVHGTLNPVTLQLNTNLFFDEPHQLTEFSK